MKARLLWLPLLIGIVVVLSGCPGLFGDPGGDDDGDDEPADTTSPTEVTDLQVARSSGTVALVWTDPTDEDLAGIEVTWEPDGSEVQAVDPGVGEYVADDLTNGTEYTFTVAAVDESGNLSAGETVTVTPADFSRLQGSLSGTYNGETDATGSLPNKDVNGIELGLTIVAYDPFGAVEVADDPDDDADVEFSLAEPAAGELVRQADLDSADFPGDLTLSDSSAGIRFLELYAAFEDIWAYGTDDILFGTFNATEWTYAWNIYSDSVTRLTGDAVQPDGAPVVVDVLLAPGWNQLVATYDVANDSYSIANGDLPSGSEWVVLENLARAEIENEIANGDGAFVTADVPWSFVDTWEETADDTVGYLGGTVSPDGNITSLTAFDGESFEGRKIAIRVDYENPASFPENGLDVATYDFAGTDGYRIESVRAYAYVDLELEQSDSQKYPSGGSSQVVMLSEDLDGTDGLPGRVVKITGGSFTVNTDGSMDWNYTTDPATDGPITGSWAPLDSATFYSGTGTITLPDNNTVSLTGAGFQGDLETDDDVYVYGIVLYGGDITATADGLTGTGPLVWIDLDEYVAHSEEPKSESYEFGGASDVTETRGSFVEFGVIDETTLSNYAGGDGPFAGAGSGAAYAYHIVDASPDYDNIDPTTLTAGFSDEDGQRGPSVGSTLNIDFSLVNDGGLWDIAFTFESEVLVE